MPWLADNLPPGFYGPQYFGMGMGGVLIRVFSTVPLAWLMIRSTTDRPLGRALTAIGFAAAAIGIALAVADSRVSGSWGDTSDSFSWVVVDIVITLTPAFGVFVLGVVTAAAALALRRPATTQ